MNKKEITRVHYTIHTHHTTPPTQNNTMLRAHKVAPGTNILPQTPNSMPMHHSQALLPTQHGTESMKQTFCVHTGLKKGAATHTATKHP
ncbi:hypothetical protein SD955_10290, partial [Lactobacillus crispatus]|uniref:hypothetical protein n=1 Tax=Lactobacillus crispatus TaxID=47770 RepID=UPI0029C3BF3C